MMNETEAAGLLGCKVVEVEHVAESPAGTVIKTRDGTAYVVVPAAAPDGEGKTGLMLLAAPSAGPLTVHEGRTVWNGFPVRVADAGELADPESDDDDAGPATTVVSLRAELEEKTIGELRDMARARELDVPMRTKEPIIEALLAAAGEAA